MADNSLPKVPERNLDLVTYEQVKEIRVVDTSDNSKTLAIDNLTIAGTKVTVAVDGLSGTADGAFGDVLTAIAEKADTTQVEALDAAMVHLTGDETIAGVKTFSSSPIVPTPTTDMQASTKKYGDDILAAYGVDVNNVCGAVNHYKRVLADSGSVLDRTQLLKVYTEYIKQRTETVRLYLPEVGAKLRTSGLNRYGVKAYDMSTNAKDAVQATEATQPYMTVGAAPNARLGMRFVQGQTQTGLMDFDDVAFAAGDSWTLTKRVKINNKGTGRVYLGAAWIETTATTIVLNSGSVAVLTGTYNFECGRTYTLEFQYSNGTGLILVNGKPIVTVPLSGAITFGQISYSATYPADRSIYSLHLTNTRKATYQSQLDHQFLSLMFPDVESVAIGNQVWSTSNFEGTVAGDGTVIPEATGATTDGNPELITQPLDLTSGWTTTPTATIVDANTITASASGGIVKTTIFQAGKAYRVSIKGVCAGAILLVRSSASASVYKTFLANTPFDETLYLKSVDQTLYLQINGAGQLDLDSFSIKEVGKADATLVYDSVYAATTGTAYQKEVAALKTAAMWAYPNDAPAMGAVYGKLFNGYAVRLFAIFPPVKGWHVPSQAEFTQVIDYLGGTSVAGGKMKAKFGGFNNAFSNNESGFSGTSVGYIGSSGAYTEGGSILICYPKTSTYGRLTSASVEIGSITSPVLLFSNLRLVRDEAVGEDRVTLRDTSTADITSTAKTITIPNGYKVTDIRLKTANALTSIAVNLYDYANTTLLGNVLTKAAQSANTEINYTAAAIDEPIAYTNRTLRVTAAGNTGGQIDISITLEKTIKND